jgi:hypothetical protein
LLTPLLNLHYIRLPISRQYAIIAAKIMGSKKIILAAGKWLMAFGLRINGGKIA